MPDIPALSSFLVPPPVAWIVPPARSPSQGAQRIPDRTAGLALRRSLRDSLDPLRTGQPVSLRSPCMASVLPVPCSSVDEQEVPAFLPGTPPLAAGAYTMQSMDALSIFSRVRGSTA